MGRRARHLIYMNDVQPSNRIHGGCSEDWQGTIVHDDTDPPSEGLQSDARSSGKQSTSRDVLSA